MKSQISIRCNLLILALMIFAHSSYASNKDLDLEYWRNLNVTNWEKGPYRLYTLCEARANKKLSNLYYFRIAENFAYQALPCLNFEVHYSFLYYKTRGAPRFINAHRLELETNSLLQIRNGTQLNWRNRLELIKKQALPHIQFVFRHRMMAIFPIQNYGKLSSLNLYDEIYYDFDTNRITQNRFVPLEMSFAINQHTNINIFFMIRNLFSSESRKWYRSLVIGSELDF